MTVRNPVRRAFGRFGPRNALGDRMGNRPPGVLFVCFALGNNRAPEPARSGAKSAHPESREVLGQIALRITAGWTSQEIAAEFNERPPSFRHVPLPKNRATGVSSSWVNARLRTLRDEMVASVDPDPS